MKNRLFILSVLLILIIACKHDDVKPNDCQITATVKDLRGLDGCGFVFVLADGKVLEPYWQWGFCGTPPLPEGMKEDPLYNFQYADGKQIKISYELVKDAFSICMTGEMAKITCITEIEPREK